MKSFWKVILLIVISAPINSARCQEPLGESISVRIPNMHCPACARAIDGELRKLPSADGGDHDFKTRTVTVHSETIGSISDEQIRETVSKLRYQVAEIRRSSGPSAQGDSP